MSNNMPTFISPGVFTKEIDQTGGVAQGVADIGAVVVAPFSKGVGFYPTICRSLAELQTKFGVADGTFYGPYTAAQYLQQKGFVTICRVGALTGYQQKYPVVIYAESGEWTRNTDVGYLVSQSSTIVLTPNVIPTGMTFTTTNVSYSSSNSAGNFTGSINLVNVASSLALQSGQGTGTVGITNNSGSLIYNGQTSTGGINAIINFTGALNINSASFAALTGSAASASILNNILFSSFAFSSSFNYSNPSQDPMFYTANILAAYSGPTSNPYGFVAGQPDILIQSGGLVKTTDHCGNVELLVSGWLSGSFGTLTGNFNANSGTFNTCSFQWVGAPTQKVLAVLANTQWEQINSQLQSPGFVGSTLSSSYVASVSGASVMPADNFQLILSSSLGSGYGVYNFSLNESDPHYITNVFGNDATAGNQATYAYGTKIEAAYLYNLFPDTIAEVVSQPNNWKVLVDTMPSGSNMYVGEPLNFTDQYSLNLLNGDSNYSLNNATTPWIVSQQISSWNGGTPTRFNLFQVATLDEGTYTNTAYKIEISNVKLAGQVAGTNWGTFTLSVRAFSDTDKKPVYLEQYNNLTLDPTSPNYIARVIGDQYKYINFAGKIVEFGTYANVSSHIRIIMSNINYPVSAIPYGFTAYSTPIGGGLAGFVPTLAYTKASVYGLNAGKYASGVDFTGVPTGADSELISLYPTSSVGGASFNDNQEYFSPLPAGSTAGSNTTFALDINISSNGVATGSFINGTNAIPTTYDPVNESTYIKMRRFVLGFQGGFDGQSPAIDINTGANISSGNTQGLNCANSSAAGSIAYNQCIGALSNADEFDINLITTPGIIYSLHSYVTNLTIDMCENRGDCFYIADLYEDGGNPSVGQITEVVNLAAELDTNYAATYYPWVKILDTNTNEIVTVPPSTLLPAIFAANDAVAGEWFAPAGLNRGGIPNAVGVTDRTTHPERDELYSGRVNPIVTFPGEGIVIWGQKTLQVADSALNRINVRRLLIKIKKYIASISKYLNFEQNTTTTRNKFLSIVNPYLEGVQQQSGLYAFQVVMDTSNNTNSIIDQQILVGSIGIQPTKTAEFIYLPFTVVPTGASFPTA